jgi:signal transduction histidine kinase
MKPLTFERRITVWSAAVLGLAILVCGGGGALFLYNRAVRDLDNQAREVALHFYQLVRAHGALAFDWTNLHDVEEWLPDEFQPELAELQHNGALMFRSTKLGAEGLDPGDGSPRFVQLPPGRMRQVTVRDMGCTLSVAVPLDRIYELRATLLMILLVALPVMAAFIVLGCRWIAKRSLEPVRVIADESERITSEQLERRVPVPPAEDEIRRLALVLNATLDRLQTSFQQAMRFSADASHELKTPLTVLHSGLEALLASPTLGDTDRAAVADALETAKRLNAITKSLLLLARADAGRLQLDLQRVDFIRILEECGEDAQIMAEAWGLTLDSAIPEKTCVLGEAIRLRQIVSNLLDNAVKYNKPGGKIRVALTQENGSCHLEVSNTGPGIPADEAPRIFDRFQRGERHAGIAGHGLGLSLCHELARAHGGTLALVRSDTEWTSFRLTLKLCPAA